MVFNKLFKKAGDYGTLVMVEHTIFSLSFGVVSLLLATGGRLPLIKIFLILGALFCARTGANAINRVIDSNIDKKNPRTRMRQLPSGKMSKKEAVLFSFSCFVFLFVFVFFLNTLCMILLPFALLLMLFYSYTKRFTWGCHFILGAVCCLAPLGAWLAVTGNLGGIGEFFSGSFFSIIHLDVLGLAAAFRLLIEAVGSKDPIFVPIFLALANAFWVAGFDIIYAIQDIEFDRQHHVHSVPARFGVKKALNISSLCHFLAIGALLAAGWWSHHLGILYFFGIVIVSALFLVEHSLVKPGQLKYVKLASYSINEVVGVVFLFFSVAAIYVGWSW